MAQPLVVSLPHSLGKAEATRRLKSGLTSVRTDYGSVIQVVRDEWDDNRLTFEISIMSQRASGTIDVEDDHVRLEVILPWLLARIATKAQALIQQRGSLMLENKK
jgi:Putative polyhydroxyalkanoic acid system protein (PHA_gran_rgn)